MKNKQHIIPVNQPTLEAFAAYADLFKKPITTGMLTTSDHVRAFEERVASYLGVKHCVAVSSCTSGLMLVLQGLGLTGEVIVPSFTYAATGHPILWNHLTPVFADVDPKTYTLDPESVKKLITKKTSAIVATHVYGVPCDVKKLAAIAKKHKLKLVYDAAHAMGSTVGGVKAGNFGDAEVFSLSPVKVLTAAEGGIVATNNSELAEHVRLGRNYGDDGSGNTEFAGLSARMSELHAAIGLRSFAKLVPNLKKRKTSALYLERGLKKIEPRLIFQTVPHDVSTTYYNFAILIDPSVLGYTRDELQEFLAARDIRSRKYFYPPLHRQPTYAAFKPRVPLPNSNRISDNVLALPMYSHISKHDLDRILKAFKEFVRQYGHAKYK